MKSGVNRITLRGIILLLLLCPAVLRAQVTPGELSGTWTGNFTGTLWEIIDVKPEKVVVEINVAADNSITGSSHLYHQGGNYEHFKIAGRWNPQDRTITFSEDSVLDVRLSEGHNCLGTYTMTLGAGASPLRLEGRWRDNDRTVLRCPGSSVFLTKNRGPVEAKPVVKDSLLLRTSDVQSLIELAPNEREGIRVEIFDNPEIDGDVVSIFQDDRLIVRKQRLTGKPCAFRVSMPRDVPLSRIRIAAENMGTIHPCTARMRITTAAGKRYEVDITSNYSSTGMLELFARP